MLNSLVRTLGWRFLKVSRGGKFASFISWASLIAIAIGVASLIVVASVLNGFDRELKERLLRVEPQLIYSASSDLLEAVPDILATTQLQQQFLLLQTRKTSRALILNSIEAQSYPKVVNIPNYVVRGRWLRDDDRFSIVISTSTARSLGVGVDDELNVLLPQLVQTPAGTFPRMKSVRVVGLYATGSRSDEAHAYMNDRGGKVLMRYGASPKQWAAKLHNPFELDGALAQLEQLGATQITNWQDAQAALFSAVKMEKRITSIVLFAMIAIAAFNVIGALSMQVLNKRRAVAVLRTQGLSRQHVGAIFFYQGLLIGMGGLLIGALLGYILSVNLGTISDAIQNALGSYLFDPGVYYVTTLPSVVLFSDVAAIVSCSALLILIAIFIPVGRALKIHPSEALNND